MKRVYVTGGSGFLGHSVVRRLVGARDEVHLVVSADLREPAPEHRTEGVIYSTADVTDAQLESAEDLDDESLPTEQRHALACYACFCLLQQSLIAQLNPEAFD